jgi:hypothetical protein
MATTTTTTTCHCCSLQHSSWPLGPWPIPTVSNRLLSWVERINSHRSPNTTEKRGRKFQWPKVEVVEVVLFFSLKYSSDCAGFYPLLHHQRRYCSRKINLKAQNALMDTTQAQLTHARVRTKSFEKPVNLVWSLSYSSSSLIARETRFPFPFNNALKILVFG